MSRLGRLEREASRPWRLEAELRRLWPSVAKRMRENAGAWDGSGVCDAPFWRRFWGEFPDEPPKVLVEMAKSGYPDLVREGAMSVEALGAMLREAEARGPEKADPPQAKRWHALFRGLRDREL